MAKTKKPTGLTLKRSNSTFTLSWKKGDNNYNEGQSVQYRTNLKGWTDLTAGTSTTSKSVTLNKSYLFPTTSKKLNWIEMRVRGKRESYKSGKKTITPTVSDWAVKRYTINVPRKPVLTEKLNETLTNVCTFSWTVETQTTDSYWYTDTEWQSFIIKDSNVTDGSVFAWNDSKAGWRTGTKASNYSVTITEDTATIADGSWTRWFRVRSRGVHGVSEWRYIKHVYGLPYQAIVSSAVATMQEAGGFQCRVKWEAPSNPSHPIDKTIVEYSTAVPEANLKCPDDTSWTDANVSKDTSGYDVAVFPIDRLLSEDQCLFVRVNTQHDNVITYGLPVLAEGGVGSLKNPELRQVQLGDNYRVTITAENNSDVEDSYLVILYRPASDPTSEIAIGTIPHGSTSANVQAPDWSHEEAFAFGVYAAVGDYETITHDSALMKSNIVWGSGDVPKAPTNVRISSTSISGTIRVEWDWAWSEADGAELSWADHEDAWESTEQPETFVIPNINKARWNISNLDTGVKWYVKVRLMKGSGDNATFGGYSETAVIDLTSAPSIPTLVLSEPVITDDGNVTASWVYTTTDGTNQVYAEICEAEVTSEGIEYGRVIAHTETAQHIIINAADAGWETGHTYNLCVRVVSASGRVSDEWSQPVAVMVAEPLNVEITDTSLVEETETIVTDEGTETREFMSLKESPLSLTISGAGENGNVIVAVERSAAYYVDRPDETQFTGHDGETIALYSQDGDGTIEITDLIGSLDDGASYRIVATIKDELGQTDETSIDFEVHWQHQALIPEGAVEYDSENLIAKITPTAPAGALSTDVCDIYRLSADKPQLVVKDGTFGTTYVDPYPAIGQFGGYRIVFKTANGDYITEDNEIAWLDLTDEHIDTDTSIIDFEGGRIALRYNVDLSSSWAKDFTETKYLGGSVQGDWNPAVSRTSSISAVAITITDEEQIELIHRLADNPSICHVRTKEGSSFAADVQVAEDYTHDKRGKIGSYTFQITRVDINTLDGMTLAQWEDFEV